MSLNGGMFIAQIRFGLFFMTPWHTYFSIWYEKYVYFLHDQQVALNIFYYNFTVRLSDTSIQLLHFRLLLASQ